MPAGFQSIANLYHSSIAHSMLTLAATQLASTFGFQMSNRLGDPGSAGANISGNLAGGADVSTPSSVDAQLEHVVALLAPEMDRAALDREQATTPENEHELCSHAPPAKSACAAL